MATPAELGNSACSVAQRSNYHTAERWELVRAPAAGALVDSSVAAGAWSQPRGKADGFVSMSLEGISQPGRHVSAWAQVDSPAGLYGSILSRRWAQLQQPLVVLNLQSLATVWRSIKQSGVCLTAITSARTRVS